MRRSRVDADYLRIQVAIKALLRLYQGAIKALLRDLEVLKGAEASVAHMLY